MSSINTLNTELSKTLTKLDHGEMTVMDAYDDIKVEIMKYVKEQVGAALAAHGKERERLT